MCDTTAIPTEAQPKTATDVCDALVREAIHLRQLMECAKYSINADAWEQRVRELEVQVDILREELLAELENKAEYADDGQPCEAEE